MADSPQYDVKDPILILVRRGRGDRGYLVAAVDDAANPFPCVDDEEVGKAVVELLNDPSQPRFDERQLEGLDEEEEFEDEDDYEDDEAGEDPQEGQQSPPEEEPDPFDGMGLDPGEKLLFQIGSAVLGKARHLSNDYREKKKKRKSKKRRSRRR